MDDEPMWVVDCVIAPTPDFAITFLKPQTNSPLKVLSLALFDRLLGEIQAFSQHENETLTDAWLRMKEILRNFQGHNLSKGSSNSDTDKIMPRMDAMTMKMDAQYKELQSRSNNSTSNYNDDDIPMSREEEAKFMQTFRRTCFYNDYRDRDSIVIIGVQAEETTIIETIIDQILKINPTFKDS
uniref:Reverse transcriptase domain-containing protein n=1 Tax=Tanacetum cinerariifolium TaxID=118510 RepID=A0A699KXC8_TANCI|nr:reverse transcriptase domain-containing protein [Tanacetum cinerariifolium]